MKTTKEIAIQCGIQDAIDNYYLNEELIEFRKAVIADFVKSQKPVAWRHKELLCELYGDLDEFQSDWDDVMLAEPLYTLEGEK